MRRSRISASGNTLTPRKPESFFAPETSPIVGSAVFSDCNRYRYVLRRIWNESGPCVLIIGLNPSTADAVKDDPTIRRCIRFARDWGYGSLLVGNLFGYRTTWPKDLKRVADPIGRGNDRWLKRLSDQADLVVAAWGIHGKFLDRGAKVLANLANVHCLGETADGFPRHPLYLRASSIPRRYGSQPLDFIPSPACPA